MTDDIKSRLQSSTKMSNTGYHQNGRPTWWARVGGGTGARFLEIEWTRGDTYLDCVVDVPPGTEVYIGAGKGRHKTVRETVVTTEVCGDHESLIDSVHNQDGTISHHCHECGEEVPQLSPRDAAERVVREVSR